LVDGKCSLITFILIFVFIWASSLREGSAFSIDRANPVGNVGWHDRLILFIESLVSTTLYDPSP